jgi:hypothetical protein
MVDSKNCSGVFDTSSDTSLQLLVDMKTDGPRYTPVPDKISAEFEFNGRPSTLPFVWSALQPLRERGYLTTCVSNGTCTPAPVLVVGTGDIIGQSVHYDRTNKIR